MIPARRMREEGQVYPALLLAVVGGMALAVGFLGLQFLLDQESRAGSASDAAALAVGEQFRDDLLQSLGGLDADNLVGSLTSLLDNSGDWPGAQDAAEEYAKANGAEVAGAVQYDGFDTSRLQWRWTVTTRQLDTVKAAGESARSISQATVAVDLTGGLCNGTGGLEVGGTCISATDWTKACVEPPPSDDGGGNGNGNGNGQGNGNGHGNGDGGDTEFEPAPFCDVHLADLLQWRVHLVQ